MKHVAWFALAVAAAFNTFAADRYPRPVAVSSECVSCHPSADHQGNHPAGVSYLERERWSYTLRPVNAQSGFGTTIENDLLVRGRVECSSCHVTHDDETVMPFRLRTRTVAEEGMFEYQREYVALCTACHELN